MFLILHVHVWGGAHFFYHLVHSILFLIYNVADIGKVIGVQNRVHVGPKNID